MDNYSMITYKVFIFQHIKTGETRELCCNVNFISGAVYFQERRGFLGIITPAIEKPVYKAGEKGIDTFRFSRRKAIRNLPLTVYSIEELNAMEKNRNMDSLATFIKNAGQWKFEYPDNKTKLIYAHALYKRGIVLGENSCFGGTLFFQALRN